MNKESMFCPFVTYSIIAIWNTVLLVLDYKNNSCGSRIGFYSYIITLYYPIIFIIFIEICSYIYKTEWCCVTCIERICDKEINNDTNTYGTQFNDKNGDKINDKINEIIDNFIKIIASLTIIIIMLPLCVPYVLGFISYSNKNCNETLHFKVIQTCTFLMYFGWLLIGCFMIVITIVFLIVLLYIICSNICELISLYILSMCSNAKYTDKSISTNNKNDIEMQENNKDEKAQNTKSKNIIEKIKNGKISLRDILFSRLV